MSRKAKFKVESLLLNRWSPRAMSGDSVNQKELYSLFEAARWAASSFNNQPWRFIYCLKKSDQWDKFYLLLNTFNKQWSKNASVLILVLSKKTFDDGSKSKTHSFDTGAACQNLALQGYADNLVVHLIEGFDTKKARSTFKITKQFDVEVMIAIGKRGDKKHLTPRVRAREKPSSRKNFDEFVFEEALPKHLPKV